MASVVSGGTTDRIMARVLIKVVRAGSGTPARYSSTVLGIAVPFGAGPPVREFAFFIGTVVSLRRRPQAHAPRLHFGKAAERVGFRIHVLSLQPLPIVIHVDQLTADVIGTLGNQKQSQMNLFLGVHAAGKADILSLFDFF